MYCFTRAEKGVVMTMAKSKMKKGDFNFLEGPVSKLINSVNQFHLPHVSKVRNPPDVAKITGVKNVKCTIGGKIFNRLLKEGRKIEEVRIFKSNFDHFLTVY